MTLLIIISFICEVDDSFNENDDDKKNNHFEIVCQVRIVRY